MNTEQVQDIHDRYANKLYDELDKERQRLGRPETTEEYGALSDKVWIEVGGTPIEYTDEASDRFDEELERKYGKLTRPVYKFRLRQGAEVLALIL